MAWYADMITLIEADGTPSPLAAGGNNKACKGVVDPLLENYVAEVTDPSACGVPPESTSSPTTSPPTTLLRQRHFQARVLS